MIYKKSALSILLVSFIFSNFVYATDINAIEYSGFGGRPAFPRTDNPRTESIFIHTINPGEKKDEGILVINNTKEKKTFLVYAADSTPSTDGAFACKQFSEEKKEVGAWIKLEKSEVTIDPGTNELVPFIILAPEKVDVGEHNGCILIQEKKSDSIQGKKNGVSLSLRTGLRVALTIPGEIVRELRINDFKLEKRKDGNIIFKPSVQNLGNVSIDTNIKVITKYFFGKTYEEQGGVFVVLRDEKSEWNFELKKPFFGGWYKTKFIVEYDKDKKAGVGVTSGENLTILEGENLTFFSLPTLRGFIIEVAVLLFMGFCAYILIVYLKRAKWIKTTWKEINIARSTNIKALGEKYMVSWKLIAKVNSIKPPYTVSTKDRLLLPSDINEIEFNNLNKFNIKDSFSGIKKLFNNLGSKVTQKNKTNIASKKANRK